jgi:probable HAF family extracellular repeat protein
MAIYDVFELQPQDESAISTDSGCINASGLAGGLVSSSQGLAGTTWSSPSNPQSISSPASVINDVKDNGDGAGVFGVDNTATQHVFLLSGGSVVDLFPTLPLGAVGLRINNKGVLVGGTIDFQGFIYDSVAQTPPVLIPPLPGLDSSFASAINQSGAVAGISGQNLPSHGYVFRGGAPVDLGSADFVEDINDSGVVAGSVGKAGPEFFHAVICDTTKANPSFTELPLPPGGFTGSHGFAINNKGDVVGTCWTPDTFDGDQTAYIFTSGASTDLNTLIPSNSGWRLQFANDINDNGQIVGRGLLNAQIRGFLLTPISSINLGGLLAKVIEVVGQIIGFQTIDGSGIIIVGGIPHPVGPWGPRVGDYAQKSDIIISLALEEMATHIGNVEGQVALRRAALEVARAQIEVLLARLREGGE